MAVFESYQHFNLRANRRDYSSTRQAWDWRKTYLGRRNNSKQSTQEDRTGNESNSWDKSQTSRLEWNDQPSWNSSFEVSQGANNWSRLFTMSNNKSIATETEEQETYSFRPIGRHHSFDPGKASLGKRAHKTRIASRKATQFKRNGYPMASALYYPYGLLMHQATHQRKRFLKMVLLKSVTTRAT